MEGERDGGRERWERGREGGSFGKRMEAPGKRYREAARRISHMHC